MNWKDSEDVVLGTIRVDYADRDALERDLHGFWDSIPEESNSNDHSRVKVIVRDCRSGREFYLNRTLPLDECVSALNNKKSEAVQVSYDGIKKCASIKEVKLR